jgi:DUF1016 N-terminal domain
MTMDKLQSQFSEILDLIKDAQYQVITTTNQSLIQLYWAIGQAISNRLKNSEWGKKTSEQLACFIVLAEYPTRHAVGMDSDGAIAPIS